MKFKTITIISILALTACGNQFDKQKDKKVGSITDFLSANKSENGSLSLMSEDRSDVTVGPIDVLNIPKDYELNLQGRNLTIIAGEINSDGGKIMTFDENAKAAPGFPGLSGGTVKIIADKFQGNLEIQMRGQEGGDGLGKGVEKNYVNKDSFINEYASKYCVQYMGAGQDIQKKIAANWSDNPILGSLGGAGGNSGFFDNRISQFSGDLIIKSLPGKSGKRGPLGVVKYNGAPVPFDKPFEVWWASGQWEAWMTIQCLDPNIQDDSQAQSISGLDLNPKK